jgi:hypothetical protein
MGLAILLLALLTFQTATVIDVYTDSQVTLALQMGDVIYTAEFSKNELKPDSIHEGDQVKAEVRHGRMTVQALLNGGSFNACKNTSHRVRAWSYQESCSGKNSAKRSS